MRVDLTLIQLNAIRTMLRDAFDEDEQGWLDCLEGETDAFEMLRKLLNGIERDEGDQAQLTEQMANRKARRDRCEARIKEQRDAIAAILECARLDKLVLPEATLSLRKVAPKVVVVAPELVPDELCTFTRKPSLAAIKEAEGIPAGCSLDNGGYSLTVRRK